MALHPEWLGARRGPCRGGLGCEQDGRHPRPAHAGAARRRAPGMPGHHGRRLAEASAARPGGSAAHPVAGTGLTVLVPEEVIIPPEQMLREFHGSKAIHNSLM